MGKRVLRKSDEEDEELGGMDEMKFGDERLDEEGNSEIKDDNKEKEEGNKPDDM